MTGFDLYNQQILRLAGSIPRIDQLESPNASVTGRQSLSVAFDQEVHA